MGTRKPLTRWAPPGVVLAHVPPPQPSPAEAAERAALMTWAEGQDAEQVDGGRYIEPDDADGYERRLSTL